MEKNFNLAIFILSIILLVEKIKKELVELKKKLEVLKEEFRILKKKKTDYGTTTYYGWDSDSYEYPDYIKLKYDLNNVGFKLSTLKSVIDYKVIILNKILSLFDEIEEKQKQKEKLKKTKTKLISKFLCWILNLKDLEIINDYSDKIKNLEVMSKIYDDYDNYDNYYDYYNISDKTILSLKIISNLESFLLNNKK